MIVVQICFFIADLLVLLALHQNTIVKTIIIPSHTVKENRLKSYF